MSLSSAEIAYELNDGYLEIFQKIVFSLTLLSLLYNWTLWPLTASLSIRWDFRKEPQMDFFENKYYMNN
jgi:hypothetical protein